MNGFFKILRPYYALYIHTEYIYGFNIDIAALTETRIAEESQLREDGRDYIFFWKGNPSQERRIHRLEFAIQNDLLQNLSSPDCINEHLMNLEVKLDISVISEYAPKLHAEEHVKERFFYELYSFLSKILKEHKVVLLETHIID